MQDPPVADMGFDSFPSRQVLLQPIPDEAMYKRLRTLEQRQVWFNTAVASVGLFLLLVMPLLTSTGRILA